MDSLSAKIVDLCTRQSRKFDFYRLGFVVLIGLLAYSNTFYSPFIFDDTANLVNNPRIMDLSISGLQEAFNSRRAVGIITFQLNYFFSEWNVVWFHLTNIIIHIFASLSVYRLLQLLMATDRLSANTDDHFSNLPIPFFAALLFVAHPVQTQAITYIVQRFASLATLFYLAAIVSYLSARLNQVALRKLITVRSVAWYCATLVCAFLAFYTKETAYTLPLAIMLVELIFFQSTGKKIFWIITVSTSAVIAVLLKYATATHSVQNAISAIDEATRLQTITSRTDYLFTQFRVLMTYLRLIFFPVNQKLDYDYTLSRAFMDWQVLCSFLVILTLLLSAFLMLKNSRNGSPHLRLIAFGILWFFLTLSVESSIIPIIDLIFEHRLYLPLFGAVTVVSSAVIMLGWGRGESSGKAVCIGLLMISFLLAFATHNRNIVWSSEVSIWADTVNKSPNSARAWNNLGAAHIKQKDSMNALRAIIRSIELDPSKADAWNNLGIAIDVMSAYNNRFHRTSEMFSTPESMKVENVNRWLGDVNNSLGLAYEILGNMPKAAENYKNAVGYNPALTIAYYNLGIVSARMGDAPKYSEQVQILRMIDPSLAEHLQGRVEKRP